MSVALLVAAVAGVLTALTPGLYPLISVTLVAFGPGTGRRLLGSALLGLAMGALLAALGAAAGAFGQLAAEPFASVAGLGFLTLLCVVMGAAMLGLFPVQLPPALAARLAQVRGRGAFALCLVSLPVATPWLAPPVAGLAALAMHLGSSLWGAALAAAFAGGLALPWLGMVLGMASLGGRMATGGVWMQVVRLLLAAAIWTVAGYFMARAWPAGTPLLHQRLVYPGAWGMALLLVGSGAGAFMLTSRRLARATSLRAAGAVLMSLGLGLVLLEASHGPTSEAPAIVWETQHDLALAQAQLQHKPLFLDFTADWCQPCQQLEHQTYVDPAVRRAAGRFVMAKIDCTAMDAATQALFARYKIAGLPAVLFFDSDGQLLAEPRLSGYVGPARLLELMDRVR